MIHNGSLLKLILIGKQELKVGNLQSHLRRLSRGFRYKSAFNTMKCHKEQLSSFQLVHSDYLYQEILSIHSGFMNLMSWNQELLKMLPVLLPIDKQNRDFLQSFIIIFINF